MTQRFFPLNFWLVGGALVVAAHGALAAGSFPADQIEFFEKQIRPLLAERCYDCHSANKHENGLRLDLRSSLIRGSDYGKVVEPGNPAASKLIKAIKHAAGVEAMPKKGEALRPEQIAAIEKWIQMGLPWPEEKEVANEHAKADPNQHWAYQPVKPSPAFAKSSGGTGSNPIDVVVGAKLNAAGLDFAPPADAVTLCRRIHSTLTGLQPTFKEVQTFAAAATQNQTAAVDALVTRLLGSQQYGERWARHWLDVARYADTSGYQVAGKSNFYPYAYTYRDWVVKSFNDDLPYDQFLMAQLAADKMVPAGQASPMLAALGFLNIGDRFISDKLLQIDDRIDVVARGMLGLTVGCARCHDHKYDPIPSRDYYALYSIFNSSEEPEQEDLPVIGEPTNAAAHQAYQARVAEIAKKELDYKKQVYDEIRKPDRLAEYLSFARETQDMADMTAFRGRAGQVKLRDRVADKWRDFLKRYALGAKPHPVMLAWKEFAALPEKDFAAKAAAIVQTLIKPERGLGGVPRNELAKRPAPKSFKDVAGMYADIFLANAQPNNEDWKQVRELLQADVSPMSVPVEQADVFFTRKDRESVVRINNERTKLETTHPGAPPRAMVMVDKPKPADVRIFMRGNPARQGDPAPRAWLTMFGGEKFTDGSGRLELARKIAAKDNPLTPRVIVNRVWAEHFGKPLVGQTSDFGVQTPKPVQAELLDGLAAVFMEQGWSLKNLHRLILTSRTFQQSADTTPAKELKDAENDLLCRYNRHRLDYESMRDAMLLAAGDLNQGSMGGRAVALDAKDVDTRRSLYLLVDRYEQATVPAMFDFANPDSHSPQRYVTTVPQQALFLMNSPFMKQRAEKIAASTPVQGSTIDSQTIHALYHRVLLRDAKPEEVDLAQRFCNDAAELNRSSASFLWRYGYGNVEKAADGKVALATFEPFKHFDKIGQNTHRWFPASAFPDKQFGHLFMGANTGHPGTDFAVVMQWTSPGQQRIRISGVIKRASERGNGVRVWIISNKAGSLREEFVRPAGSVEIKVEVNVAAGEVLSFVVDSEKSTDSDGFTWSPVIDRIDPATGAAMLLTKADDDFCGPDGWPLKRAKPQSPLAQLAQVLLMSNEFQFID